MSSWAQGRSCFVRGVAPLGAAAANLERPQPLCLARPESVEGQAEFLVRRLDAFEREALLACGACSSSDNAGARGPAEMRLLLFRLEACVRLRCRRRNRRLGTNRPRDPQARLYQGGRHRPDASGNSAPIAGAGRCAKEHRTGVSAVGLRGRAHGHDQKRRCAEK